MGGFFKTEERVEVEIVFTSHGSTKFAGQTYPKSRVYIFPDHRGVLCIPGPPETRHVTYIPFDVEHATWSRYAKQLVVNINDNDTLTLDGKGCSCTMGVVGNAGPLDGNTKNYGIIHVRAPDWFVQE